MAYLLVMGGLALSVFFTLGWCLVCATRWLVGRLPGAGGQSPGRARRAPTRPRAKPRAKPPSKSPSTARKATPAKTPSEPWGLTQWLARQRSPLPLGLLMLLLYGGSRLAEYGMAFRPQAAPGAYHGLVSTLGWVAAVLLILACMNLLAVWRCRRQG